MAEKKFIRALNVLALITILIFAHSGLNCIATEAGEEYDLYTDMYVTVNEAFEELLGMKFKNVLRILPFEVVSASYQVLEENKIKSVEKEDFMRKKPWRAGKDFAEQKVTPIINVQIGVTDVDKIFVSYQGVVHLKYLDGCKVTYYVSNRNKRASRTFTVNSSPTLGEELADLNPEAHEVMKAFLEKRVENAELKNERSVHFDALRAHFSHDPIKSFGLKLDDSRYQLEIRVATPKGNTIKKIIFENGVMKYE